MLTRILAESNLTQKELAKRMNISTAYLSQLINKKRKLTKEIEEKLKSVDTNNYKEELCELVSKNYSKELYELVNIYISKEYKSYDIPKDYPNLIELFSYLSDKAEYIEDNSNIVTKIKRIVGE